MESQIFKTYEWKKNASIDEDISVSYLSQHITYRKQSNNFSSSLNECQIFIKNTKTKNTSTQVISKTISLFIFFFGANELSKHNNHYLLVYATWGNNSLIKKCVEQHE